MTSKINVDKPGSYALLNGDEATARGAIEANIKVAAAYPGTPSTEILETLAVVAKDLGIYVEWSLNEIIATEVAIGASMTGVRALTSMKHVGSNVASDAIMTLAYTGIEGGLIIVICDDPALHSSQNEQDTRYFAVHAKLPLLDAGNPQEALDMARKAYEISEKLRLPIILRLTTRVAHGKARVKLGELQRFERKAEFDKDISKWVMVPANASRQHRVLESKLLEAKNEAETSPFNIVEDNSSDIGIIGSGVGYYYARSLLDTSKISWLKLGFVHPFPSELVKTFASKVKKLIVLEELRPYIEENIARLKIDFIGKTELGLEEIGEFSPDKIRTALAKLHLTTNPEKPQQLNLPPRPPGLCPGCTHRALYYTLNMIHKSVYCDSNKCVGCGTCEYACSYNKEKVYNTSKSRIRVVRQNQIQNIAITCQVCQDPACVAACPRDALSQSPITGNIIVDKNQCNGCGWCIEACQYGALNMHPTTHKPIVCDGCGGNPRCVALCPQGALSLRGKSEDKIVAGDIGCYTLGALPPVKSLQTCLCMGGGISQAAGMIHAGVKDKVFAVIGDSTFFHGGMPGLLNIVYNQANVCVIIMDNSIVAMTGHQPTPGSGKTAMGQNAKIINIESLVRALGIEKVITVDPYDIKATTKALRTTINYEGPSVIIAKRPCPLLAPRDIPLKIKDQCRGCRVCTEVFGCPAISQTSNRAEIDATLCNGCGVCEKVCPFSAIVREEQ
ncbi:MAG: 4Fe-4S binding protein [Nitrososphaerota archaeon]|jgi:TPP-dependent indolepyruvate ferredoxin oxidoreductase alpha subunit|nr:4Fe-4S binding protein [Nitrososphaerota archaeon]